MSQTGSSSAKTQGFGDDSVFGVPEAKHPQSHFLQNMEECFLTANLETCAYYEAEIPSVSPILCKNKQGKSSCETNRHGLCSNCHLVCNQTVALIS